MEGSTPEVNKRRRQHRRLIRLEASLEPVMFLLAFVWLWLFVVEVFLQPPSQGLPRWQELAATSIWIAFILEFLLKLYLAPRPLQYAAQNWITVVALVIPAFRAVRLLRALRILRLSRVVTTTRLVRALTSTRRAYSELKAAQGPAPEPEMNVAVLAVVSRDGDLSACQQLALEIAGHARPEIESATGIRWVFHQVEPAVVETNAPRKATDFIEEASLRMTQGPYDLVLVVTDAGLLSRRRRIAPGLVSSTSRIAVISTRYLTATARGQMPYSLGDAAVRRNGGALLLHLLGRIGGLRPGGGGTDSASAPFVFRGSRNTLPRFTPRERNHLARVGSRMPERELKGGTPLASLIFHFLMATRHPLDVLKPLLRNRALLLPLSLPSLATAAVAPCFLLVFTAEIWDVGLGMSNSVATLYATISIIAASFYLSQAQSLFLPRKAKHTLTEHLAVANTVIFLSILLACIGLFLMVGVLMLLIELFIFPPDLVQTWPTLDQPAQGFGDTLRLAAFISTIGVTTGALAGGIESRTVIQNLALFEDND